MAHHMGSVPHLDAYFPIYGWVPAGSKTVQRIMCYGRAPPTTIRMAWLP
jgi:hypothetical protein